LIFETRLLICAALLGVTALIDLKTREVDDKIWVIFGALGLTLSIIEVILGVSPNVTLYIVSFGLTSGLAFLLYFLKFYGGADAKALSAISLILPLFEGSTILHPISGITILTNSVFLTLAFPIYLGIKNLILIIQNEKIFEGLESEPIYRRIFACLLGYRIRKGSKNKFLLRLEKTIDGRRRFDFSLIGDDEDFVTETEIWVTPGIPLLFIMALGFAFMYFIGDILGLIILNVFRLI